MKRFVTRCTAVLAMASVLTACGYLKSGRWEDDPGNWSRAFGGAKPANVDVVHSYCWRSPHFTYEGGYFFALRDRGGFRAELFSRNKLTVVAPGQESASRVALFGNVPKWFAPKAADRYEVWRFAEEPRGNFVIFIDTDDGMLYLADYQV
jgi:hypothetical protein